MKYSARTWPAVSLIWHKVAEQKFGQLRPGQRFLWQDKIWQKTSPLLASAEGEEEQRIVPRSTRVALKNTTANTTTQTATDAVRRTLAQLQQESLKEMELLQLAPDQFQAIRKILSQATENAADSLGLSVHEPKEST